MVCVHQRLGIFPDTLGEMGAFHFLIIECELYCLLDSSKIICMYETTSRIEVFHVAKPIVCYAELTAVKSSLCVAEGGSKYTEIRDQHAGGLGSGDMVSSPTSTNPPPTADLIDFMSSGSPEYRGQLLAASHLQVRPRPTPPKKAQSCQNPVSVNHLTPNVATWVPL